MKEMLSALCPICGNTHTTGEPCPTPPHKTDADTEELDTIPNTSIIGQTFGSFRAVRRIGEGGMGAVYLGENTFIGSKVAIKILHEHLAVNPVLVQRFYAEAKAVNLIGHANIVNIFDMNLIPPRLYYLIMEYLEGYPLNDLLIKPVECSMALGILEQVCDALDAAHAHGVIHRDLKPENIFITKVGRNERFVKVLDFGIAKLFSESTAPKTASGIIVGTPEYMAPEQTSGLPVGAQTDIYALGIVAYAMATARLPFGGTLADLLVAHRERAPTPPIKLNPQLPKAWSDAILKALNKNPAERYATCVAFAETLAKALKPGAVRAKASKPKPMPMPAASASTQTLLTPAPSPLPHLPRSCQPPPLPSSKAPLPKAEQAQPCNPPEDNTSTDKKLYALKKRFELPNPYAQLELSEDVELGLIRARIREIQKTLNTFEARNISDRQRQVVQNIKENLRKTLATIGSPLPRASFDAQQKNFRGIARAISAGLKASEMEVLRKKHLSLHPKAESIAHSKRMLAEVFSKQGDISKAIQLMEEALSQDPLNLGLHQRYWTLRNQEPQL